MAVPQEAKKNRVLLTFFVIILFIVIAFAIYIRSPFANVKTVRVFGAQDVPVVLIVRDTGIHPGENLYKIPVQYAEHRLLSDFPILQTVQIDRNFFRQSVAIVVKEKTVAGILAAGGSLYRVLADGTVLDRDPTGVGVNQPIITTSMPIAVSLGMKLTNPALLSLCKQLPLLPTRDLMQLSELHLENGRTQPIILAFTRDGFELSMQVANLANSLRLYDAIHQRLLAAHVAPGLIDLLSGREAVYKPYVKPPVK